MDHDDHVAALGGGVVGDVAGFCAGGLPARGRRRAGADDARRPGRLGLRRQDRGGPAGGQELRRRLPPAARGARRSARARDAARAEELAAGWAEVIKTALIAGGPLWARVRRGDADVDRDLVLACARTKLGVVARDERDAGRRQVLNLGHTVGHAIETATGYARYRHGEAVGLGLLAALTLSGQPELRSEVAELLEEHGLPTTLDADVDHEARAHRRAARQEAPRRPGRVRPRRGARRRPHRRAGGRGRRPRRARSCCDEEPRGRPARHQPRRAGPAPGGALRRADVHAARAADRALRARARAVQSTSSSPTTRASSSRSCTRRPTTPTG